MREDDEAGGSGIALGRTLALSDGIFAIAMTLLAFQIQPPDLHGSQIHHLASALGSLGSRYFVYVLSFAVIGTLWLAHHRTFSHVRRADEALMSLNVLFLMAVAASLLGALLLLARRRRLLTPEATHEGIAASLWSSAASVAVFTLSIPVALAAPAVAPYTWLVVIPLRLVRGRVSKHGDTCRGSSLCEKL